VILNCANGILFRAPPVSGRLGSSRDAGQVGRSRRERSTHQTLYRAAAIGENAGLGDPRTAAGAATINNQLTSEEIEVLQQKLEELRLEHRDLDDVINHLDLSAYPDRKLRLKDSIQRIESRLIPDIDA
jgi:hypothetical protein